MKKNFLIATTISVIALGAFGYNFWINSPQYSLLQIQKSIENKDRFLFDKYVDTNGITEDIIVVLTKIFIEEMVNQLEKLGEGYICFSKYIEVENDCKQSSSHLKVKNNLNFLKSNSKFIRKIYYYLLDNANGKCNLFYSLIICLNLS